MRVLIIGAGAVGVAIGASLGSLGADVHFQASENTADKIRQGGITRFGLFNEIHIPPEKLTVYTDYNDICGEFDYIIISAKAFSNEDISDNLHRRSDILKSGGKIVIMQNGIGTDEPFLRYFDKSQIYNARVITGFERTEPNSSKITVHNAPILIGSLYGCGLDGVEELAELIDRSGLPCRTDGEIGKALWAKLLYNTTLNPLGAILDCSYGRLYESDYAKSIMEQLVHESFEVIKAGGYKAYQDTADEYIELLYNKLIPDTYNHCSSTLQDIRKRQKTEIDTLNGSIVKLGKALNVDTPAHSLICRIIKAIEDNY